MIVVFIVLYCMIYDSSILLYHIVLHHGMSYSRASATARRRTPARRRPYVYIYIYIYAYIYIYIHTHTYVYIYIYICRERERHIYISYNNLYTSEHHMLGEDGRWVVVQEEIEGEVMRMLCPGLGPPLLLLYIVVHTCHIYIYIYIYMHTYIHIHIYIYIYI